MPRKPKANPDLAVFLAVLRMLSDWSTTVCKLVSAKGGSDLFLKYCGEKHATRAIKAAQSESFKASGKLLWVHSVFDQLVAPIRDKDGDYVATSKPSLSKQWAKLLRDGQVSSDLRTVSDLATEQGLVKRKWQGRFLTYAVTADLPERESSKVATLEDGASIMHDLKKYMK